MMIHPDEALLHDFADDELEGEERARVVEHLAACPSCRDVVTDIRALRDDVVRVFAPPAPGASVPSDQWPAIESRIHHSGEDAPVPIIALPGSQDSRVSRPEIGIGRGSRPAWFRIAAAIVLIGLSSSLTYLAVRTGAPGSDAGSIPPAPFAGFPEDGPAVAIMSAYLPVFAELEEILEEGRERLQPETIAVLEENLRILDAAVLEVQEALAADPAHPSVLRSLDGVYRTKLQLLRQAVNLTRGA